MTRRRRAHGRARELGQTTVYEATPTAALRPVPGTAADPIDRDSAGRFTAAGAAAAARRRADLAKLPDFAEGELEFRHAQRVVRIVRRVYGAVRRSGGRSARAAAERARGHAHGCDAAARLAHAEAFCGIELGVAATAGNPWTLTAAWGSYVETFDGNGSGVRIGRDSLLLSSTVESFGSSGPGAVTATNMAGGVGAASWIAARLERAQALPDISAATKALLGYYEQLTGTTEPPALAAEYTTALATADALQSLVDAANAWIAST